jgi:hypothetical protein
VRPGKDQVRSGLPALRGLSLQLMPSERDGYRRSRLDTGADLPKALVARPGPLPVPSWACPTEGFPTWNGLPERCACAGPQPSRASSLR